ncbi:MAG: radical SAM protein, partial [Candidatus Margulisbacteria bacterium]|nr:radical SAM protein [Candidatus Margulisiibacteriota bacterium]
MHNKIISTKSIIHLNKSGNLFIESGTALIKLNQKQVVASNLKTLQDNPEEHFFRMPFNSISYVVKGRIIETITAHPSSFYPGSPFDVFMAVKAYLQKGKHILPRFYLYPSSACNSKCIICPFTFRHKTPFFIPLESITGIIDFMDAQQPRPRTLSAIISGDGEPTLHKDMDKFLRYMYERNIRTFLSSNFIFPGTERQDKEDSIADTVSMLTISIKGLSPSSYLRYQGLDNPQSGLDRVMENLEKLIKKTEDNGRRKDMLVGVASLILPENTGSYTDMTKRFVDLGLDYVYLNVVEPSYKAWGIQFDKKTKAKTIEELEQLAQFSNSGTMIRYSTELFKGTTGESVYYDARTRNERDICGSALWNPLFMSMDKKPAVIACRASDKFQKTEFAFTRDIYRTGMAEIFSGSRINQVMSVTEHCEQCRLERQVRLFDDLIRIERANEFRGEFVLDFPP